MLKYTLFIILQKTFSSLDQIISNVHICISGGVVFVVVHARFASSLVYIYHQKVRSFRTGGRNWVYDLTVLTSVGLSKDPAGRWVHLNRPVLPNQSTLLRGHYRESQTKHAAKSLYRQMKRTDPQSQNYCISVWTLHFFQDRVYNSYDLQWIKTRIWTTRRFV